ncbi:MAG: hypothetical protein ACR2PG_20355, partial [Hyphomicrobiaceae bacterium]
MKWSKLVPLSLAAVALAILVDATGANVAAQAAFDRNSNQLTLYRVTAKTLNVRTCRANQPPSTACRSTGVLQRNNSVYGMDTIGQWLRVYRAEGNDTTVGWASLNHLRFLRTLNP